MKERVQVKALPFGNTTEEGRFYAVVDGEKVGENGRCFWEKRSDARACGIRFLMRKDNQLLAGTDASGQLQSAD